ncbi:peroxisome membrane protein [Terfezia boudieri ATCC MYA-4762]|uniref:Peroxisomal membrane protein PEX16 n=1 Tax=Terfezia boudieri ATCC MYA-4762 TaxID=1051890 RepID=A0A3N4LYT3_9PEZI|nr:peroxisome membrane protein [Terfezia boudieri ATCC MYA-4762]
MHYGEAAPTSGSRRGVGSYLNIYGDFITKNAHAVSQIESALRSLTYIVPARFKDVELASESLHSGIQLLSLYHDSLLGHAISPPAGPGAKPTPHNRYTKFWTQKSPMYKRLALIITMIQYTELLWEMTARRRGEKIRWNVVIFLEGIKALCRLCLLKLTNGRPLLTPPLPEREIDPTSMTTESSPSSMSQLGSHSGYTSGSEYGSSPCPSPPPEPWKMPRTGLSLPSLPSSTNISQYLLSKVLTAEDIKPPIQLLHRVRGIGYVAEVLHILRPVIYAAAMRRWAHDKKSWRPWLLGLSLEYAARTLAKRDLAENVPGGLKGLTALEREELKRRAVAMGWWGMRGAFYENVTGPWLRSLVARLEGKPVIGLMAGLMEDYQYLWDNYYFSTATL